MVANVNATGGTLSCQMTQYDNLGSSCGGGNSPTGPPFVNADAGDYHATAGSAQLGFVPASFCAANACPGVDVDGTAHPSRAALDAGTDER